MKYFFIYILFTSCASFSLPDWDLSKVQEVELSGYEEFEDNDYIDHLNNFGNSYRSENKARLVQLDPNSVEYLTSLIKKIIAANELFFNPDMKPSFTIIKAIEPFHFSLPGRQFFISTGLIKKYIKNEDMLFCTLVYELIRTEKSIYTKTMIIPTGTLSTNRILSLLRLNAPDKIEIHKWAYYLLKRTGISTDSYLSWLQVKNRNSLDFLLQLGDIRTISREEAMFKAFLIEIEKDVHKTNFHRGSSKAFYRLLNDIKV